MNNEEMSIKFRELKLEWDNVYMTEDSVLVTPRKYISKEEAKKYFSQKEMQNVKVEE